MITRTLLFCGILAPLVYMGTDRLAGALLGGYNFSAQSMSELSASGSPMRTLVVALTSAATGLMIAFAVGIWRISGPTLLPHLVAVSLAANAVLVMTAMLLFPPQIGVTPTFGSVGVMLMFFSVVALVLAVIVGAVAFGGWLRILSIGLPASYVALAIVRLATATSSSVSLIGAQERTMYFGFLLWVMALAAHFLTSGGGAGSAA